MQIRRQLQELQISGQHMLVSQNQREERQHCDLGHPKCMSPDLDPQDLLQSLKAKITKIELWMEHLVGLMVPWHVNLKKIATVLHFPRPTCIMDGKGNICTVLKNKLKKLQHNKVTSISHWQSQHIPRGGASAPLPPQHLSPPPSISGATIRVIH